MTLEEFIKKYESQEIDEIDENEVRNIRIKYFNLIHKALKDENNISDKEVMKLYGEYKENERAELAEYYDKIKGKLQ